MSGGIQQLVTTQPAPGIAGDFCSANPRYSVDAGPGGLIAGPNGVAVARFAWASYNNVDGNSAPAAVNNFGSGPVTGFVGRAQQGLITTYLSDAGVTIPAGFMVTLYSAGDFWATNSGATQALPGMKAYASYATGLITFAATGNATTASGSASSIAAGTSSVTGSISGNVLYVTAVGSGTLYPGTTISGTNVASGTVIVSQLSGTTGGVGTYAVSISEQTVASTTISGTYGTLTVGGTVTGTFVNGAVLSGTNVVTGTAITAFLTGSGGAGTYVVNNNTVVSSTAITGATNVETSWYCRSVGLAGEIVKMSNLPGIG
jgi:hypothetical protein